MRLFVDSRNWPRQACWKYGEMQRTSSCAAKSRCSRPTTRVIIEDVRLLAECLVMIVMVFMLNEMKILTLEKQPLRLEACEFVHV